MNPQQVCVNIANGTLQVIVQPMPDYFPQQPAQTVFDPIECTPTPGTFDIAVQNNDIVHQIQQNRSPDMEVTQIGNLFRERTLQWAFERYPENEHGKPTVIAIDGDNELLTFCRNYNLPLDSNSLTLWVNHCVEPRLQEVLNMQTYSNPFFAVVVFKNLANEDMSYRAFLETFSHSFEKLIDRVVLVRAELSDETQQVMHPGREFTSCGNAWIVNDQRLDVLLATLMNCST